MNTKKFMPILVFATLTWLILAPLLRPGFVFALDMVPTPEWRLPAVVTSSYLFYAVMHVLNYVIPGDLLQKLMLIVIFMLMGIGMYRLAAKIEGKGEKSLASLHVLVPYIAGLIYTLNPYVYSRFMSGQFAVLLGYALLPWFALSFLTLVRKPGWPAALRTGIWAAAIGIVSIHSLGLTLLLAVAAGFAAVWKRREDKRYLTHLIKWCTFTAAIFIAISSHWLIPAMLGQSATAAAIKGFGSGDLYAFQTVGGSLADRLGNVLRLEGFWAEQTGFYKVPHSLGVFWWLSFVLLALLSVAGILRLWRSRKQDMVITFGVSAICAALLAAGMGVAWLSGHIPFFSGYREPHKFAGLVALAYSIFAATGAYAVLAWTQKHVAHLYVPVLVLIFLIPLIFAPFTLLGGGRQLRVSQYPAGWHAVNDQLNKDPDDFKVLFLPWHLYMHFGFASTIMANPADKFFDKTTLVSNDPEFRGSSPNTINQDKTMLSKRILPVARHRTDLGRKLSSLNVKYVILTSDSDAYEYRYVQMQVDLKRVFHDSQISLYENLAWRDQ